MVGQDRAFSILEQALSHSRADQTEVRLVSRTSYLTRYANSVIHQNVGERDIRLYVRVYLGKRVGKASTASLDADSVAKTVERAIDLARLAPENPEFVSLPGPKPIPSVQSFFESTAKAGPGLRADNVAKVISVASRYGFVAAGAHSTTTTEVAVANSIGVRAYGSCTGAEMTCVMLSSCGSGYAEAASRDVEDIDPVAVAEEAAQRCGMNKDQISVEPGEYEVVLDAYAVGEMVSYLAMLGLNARAYQDGYSFLCGNMGKQVASPQITIWDDGLDPAGAPFPFDLEGQPKQKVMLIDGGIGAGVVYDSMAAFKEGRESTGHAGGPVNLFVKGGQLSLRDLIERVNRGLLVTRFHYVRPVHAQKTMITGMTRDGTFLIEEGRIRGAIKNMRFTQSIIEALLQVEAVSSERKLLGVDRAVLAPAVLIRKFNFTGQAGH